MTDALEGEIWKRVPLERFDQRYEVSNLGRVRNIIFPKTLRQKISTTGYKSLNLYFGGKEKQFKVHRLVALAFLPSLVGNDTLINHINGNKLDNRASNLEWANKSINSLHAHRVLKDRKRKGGFYIPSGEEITKESWKRIVHPKFPFLGQRYEISDIGRVRRIFASKGTSIGKFISNHELGGYIGITLTPSTGKNKTFHLHILVAWTFRGAPPGDPTKYVVDHIDSNPLNPCANNLRWVSLRRNAVLGFGKLSDSQVKEIQQLYASKNANQDTLAKRFGVSQQQISRILRGRQRGGGTSQRDLRSKLTEANVNEIRQLGINGSESLKAISTRFSVSPTQVATILAGKVWQGLLFTDGKPWRPIPRRKTRMPKKQRKLSQQDIDALRATYSPGNITQKELASQYGVDRSVISRIVSKNRRQMR